MNITEQNKFFVLLPFVSILSKLRGLFETKIELILYKNCQTKVNFITLVH